MQTLDSSYAAFNRSPPWQTTTSRNTYAFQEISTALLWETWKCGSGWNILRTPKTNPLPGPTGIHTRVEIRECIYEHLAVVQWGQCTDRVQGYIPGPLRIPEDEELTWLIDHVVFCLISKSMNREFSFVKCSIICSIINVKVFVQKQHHMS